MGGDTPYDIRQSFCDVAGLDDDDFNLNERTPRTYRKYVNAKRAALYRYARKLENIETDPDYQGIAGQVFAVSFMQIGAQMTVAMRRFFIECAKADSWAKHDKERKTYIDDLIAKLEKYPGCGRVTLVAEEGLFERLEKVLSAKKG